MPIYEGEKMRFTHFGKFKYSKSFNKDDLHKDTSLSLSLYIYIQTHTHARTHTPIHPEHFLSHDIFHCHYTVLGYHSSEQ
jgi:hypothetical protein